MSAKVGWGGRGMAGPTLQFLAKLIALPGEGVDKAVLPCAHGNVMEGEACEMSVC